MRLVREVPGWGPAILLLVFPAGCSFPPSVPFERVGGQPIAFVDVNVLPMDRERVLRGQTVVIQGERIVAMGSSNSIDIAPEAYRIDGRGKYLMPGLTDMHVHLGEEEEFVLFLANGVTTIRVMWGEAPWTLDWRRRINDGELIGPRIYSAGPVIDGSWPGALADSERMVIVDDPEAAFAFVATQKEMGYDFIKILSHLSPEAYDAILSAALRLDIPVAGHVPYQVDIETALTSGQRSIEHLEGYNFALMADDAPSIDPHDRAAWLQPWEYFDESRLEPLARATAEADVWNVPTLVIIVNGRILPEELGERLEQPNLRYVVPYTLDYWAEREYIAEEARIARETDAYRKQMVKALSDAGARLLIGTDTPQFFVVPGFSVHEELEHFVDAGLSPFEALRAGTSNPAEFLGAANEFGTVEVGMIADLMLLNENPLDDITHTTRRAGVMVRGAWFSEDRLHEMLEQVAVGFERERIPDSSR